MNLTTLSEHLRIARNEADEDGTLLDLTTEGDYANIPSVLGDTGTGVIDLMQPDGTEEDITGQIVVNGLEFYISAGSAAAKTLGWRLLGWRVKGPARLVAIGTAITSTQALVTYPHNGETATNKFWTDTFVLTWSNWPQDHIGVTDTDGNSNSVGSIWLDAMGYRYWKVEITNADGSTGDEAGDVAVYWGFW